MQLVSTRAQRCTSAPVCVCVCVCVRRSQGRHTVPGGLPARALRLVHTRIGVLCRAPRYGVAAVGATRCCSRWRPKL